MRYLLAFILAISSGPAFAHIGHIGEVAGHSHWIALGGIAIAGAIALLGARKKSDKSEPDDDPEEIQDDEEAPA